MCIRRKRQGNYESSDKIEKKSWCQNSKKQIIFIHVPKAAGHSLRIALKCKPSSHCRAIDIPGKFQTYTKVACVRNPWDRLVSLYHYYLGRPDIKPVKTILDRYKSFGDFALDLKNIPIAEHRYIYLHNFRYWGKKENNMFGVVLQSNFHPMTFWLCNNEGEVIVDDIVSFENIKRDFVELGDKYNWGHKKKNLKKVHASKHSDYKEYYTSQDIIDAVAAYYISDIDTFKYEF